MKWRDWEKIVQGIENDNTDLAAEGIYGSCRFCATRDEGNWDEKAQDYFCPLQTDDLEHPCGDKCADGRFRIVQSYIYGFDKTIKKSVALEAAKFIRDVIRYSSLDESDAPRAEAQAERGGASDGNDAKR